MKHQTKNSFTLDPMETSAIILALPLVQNIADNGNEQALLNRTLVQITARKLHSGNTIFNGNEIRIMLIAVGFALDILTGKNNPYLIQEECNLWKEKLSKYLLSYNKIYPKLETLFQQFEAVFSEKHP